MSRFTTFLLGLSALGLVACAPVELSTRNMPEATGVVRPASSGYAIGGLSVDVPQALRVSEANSFYPFADIVWRGDPPGERRTQVEALFTTAAARAGSALHGRPVNVGIEVVRFHGLTEKTRFTVGGSYSISFRLTLTDPATGRLVETPRIVEASLPQAGGSHALSNERRGLTEKVLVTQFLTRVLRTELGPVTG